MSLQDPGGISEVIQIRDIMILYVSPEYYEYYEMLQINGGKTDTFHALMLCTVVEVN